MNKRCHAAEVFGDPTKRTPVDNQNVRNVFVIGPDTPEILAKRIDVLSPRMIRMVEISASSRLPMRSKCWRVRARVAGS
jgi:hypothetical protein